MSKAIGVIVHYAETTFSQTDGQTDRETDSHSETSIPPQLCLGGGIIKHFIQSKSIEFERKY